MPEVSKRSSYDVSVGALGQIIAYLNHAGIDMESFYQALGMSPNILSSPDKRIPIEKYILAENTAAHLTKDPYLGLHMGQFAHTENWSTLGYMMMHYLFSGIVMKVIFQVLFLSPVISVAKKFILLKWVLPMLHL